MNEETFEYKGFNVRIVQDEDAQSPEDYADSPIFLVHLHRQFYRLPDDKRLPFSGESGFRTWMEPAPVREDYRTREEFRTALREYKADHKGWMVFPVAAYIHGGVALSLGDGSGYPDAQWDVSHCGFVLIDTTDEGYWGKKGKYKYDWRKIAKAHVEEWNQFLSGDVWGYIIERLVPCGECGHVEHNEEESCWGFYGRDYCEQEARSVVDSIVERKEKKVEAEAVVQP